MVGAQAVKSSFKLLCVAQSEGFSFSRKVNLTGRFVTGNASPAGSLTHLGGHGEEEAGSETWMLEKAVSMSGLSLSLEYNVFTKKPVGL